ncbi:MAG: gamma-glutamyltransferase, partial [Bacteroidota bacterium]
MTGLLVLSLCLQCFPGQDLMGQSASMENAYQYSIRKKATGESGAVVSAHPLATRAGLDILKQGGNAIDASIAVQLALAVVYPGAGNLGGGGFLVA